MRPDQDDDEDSDLHITVVIQNLQKKAGLAGGLMREHSPDLLLAQEISLTTEDASLVGEAHHTSRMGYGTAIGTKGLGLSNVHRVTSPVPEIGGFIKKKTVVADFRSI